MAHTHITGSAYVATVDSIGSDIELGIFKYITTPRIFAQDVEPPTGPITTGDTVTSITKLIAPGTYRVLMLKLQACFQVFHLKQPPLAFILLLPLFTD